MRSTFLMISCSSLILLLINFAHAQEKANTNNVISVQNAIDIQEVFEKEIKKCQLPEEAIAEWKKHEGKLFLVKGKLEKINQHKAGGVVLVVSVGKEKDPGYYMLVACIMNKSERENAAKMQTGKDISIVGLLEKSQTSASFFNAHNIAPYPYDSVDVFLVNSSIIK